MQQPTTRVMGGAILAASAVVLAAATILHSPLYTSLAEYGESSPGVVAPWLMALAGLLWIAGAIVLARQFSGTRAEIWATLAYGAALFAAVALFAVGALEAFGYVGLATGTLFSHTDEAFTALSSAALSLGMMGVTAYYAAVAFYGAAMLASDAWPRWLGWSGLVVGAAIVILNATIANSTALGGTLAGPLYLVGLIWVAVAGYVLRGKGRPAPIREPGMASVS